MPRIERDQLQSLMRDSVRVSQALQSFDKSSAVLSETSRQLTEQYADKWIGIDDGRVVDVADSLEALAQSLAGKGIPFSETAVRRMDREEQTLIL
jgi:hypothetical protein